MSRDNPVRRYRTWKFSHTLYTSILSPPYEMKVRTAPCRRAPCRGLHAAEDLQLNSLNRQMFVLGFVTQNRPALFPSLGEHFSCHLYIVLCEQSASPVSERGPPQVPF
jgi:hypothetical protein